MFCLRDPFSLKAGGRRKRRMRENEVEKWTIITIPGSLYKEAKKWAEAWGCTAEEFIIEAIEKAIEEEKKKREK